MLNEQQSGTNVPPTRTVYSSAGGTPGEVRYANAEGLFSEGENETVRRALSKFPFLKSHPAADILAVGNAMRPLDDGAP